MRLSPGNATALYDMVRREGARIAISGTPPASRPFAATYASYRGADGGEDGYARPRRARRAYGDYGYGGYGGYGYQPYVDPNGGGGYSYGLGY